MIPPTVQIETASSGLPSCVFKCGQEWECDYGLSILQPNRKFKVARHVQDQRVRLWWISVYRIRALCMELLGYDPEMENFDQSPYHDNEQGSQSGTTLAIKAGGIVPLTEGHHDTRQRWTGNFTTFSDFDRIRSGDIPYVELMFLGTPGGEKEMSCLLYTSPSPRDGLLSRMPSSA